MRTVHALMQEDVNYELQGSLVFTKLNARSGLWQLSLDDETAKLVTFILPFVFLLLSAIQELASFRSIPENHGDHIQ